MKPVSQHQTSTESAPKLAGFVPSPPEAQLSQTEPDSDLAQFHPLASPELTGVEWRQFGEPAPIQSDLPVGQADRLSVQTWGTTSHRAQGEFWRTTTVFKDSIAAKLRGLGRLDLAEPLEVCHTQRSHAQCGACGKVRSFYNRCDLRHCPACAPRLGRDRRDQIKWWAEAVGQPKHVVLTVRNTDRLSKDYVQWFKGCFARLRRTKFATERTVRDRHHLTGDVLPMPVSSYKWLGGFYSIELTKENRGWHLHLHALVDCRFIDQPTLSRVWARIVGQDIAVVRVYDTREKDYLNELTKYVVKGNELASWDAEDIAAMIDSFDGVRAFGVFGSLYAQRADWKSYVESLAHTKGACECGACEWKVYDELEWAWRETTRGASERPRTAAPPVIVHVQLLASFARPSNYDVGQ